MTLAATSKRNIENDSNLSTKKKKLELDEDEPNETLQKDEAAVVVYTDGCCHNNGKDNARAGIGVYWGDNHPDNLSEKLEGRQTNNRAEIKAVIRAIEIAKLRNHKSLEIRTDSKFLINCITKWIKTWKANGWQLSTGKPVINKEELEELDKVARDIHIQYVHVRGHSGEEGNEQADKLANEAAYQSAG